MFSLLKTMAVTGAALVLATTSSAQQRLGRPGTVNYIEGQAYLGGSLINSRDMRRAEVAAGQVLSTQDGKAEMLLTPGAFLRLDAHSAVKMVTPTLTNTMVELLKGKAMVEADQVEKENHLAVVEGPATTVLEKKGIYEFNAESPAVAVYDGEATVTRDDRTVEVKKGHELALAADGTKPQKFDRKNEDELYAWSKLRSEYTSQANMSMAQTFVAGSPGWYGAGWYWNPWFDSWAFMPGAGLLYSPFGFGFYSPAYWYSYAPFYYRPHYGFVGRGYGRGPYVGRGFAGHGFAGRPAAPAMRGPAVQGPATGGGFARGGFRR